MCVIIKTAFKGWLFRLVAVVYLINLIQSTEIKNFISYNTLDDGEIETRIYYDGVIAKETSVGVRYVFIIVLFIMPKKNNLK